MKKLLLASAALIAFGATAANAQDLVTAKKGTIKLDVRATAIIPGNDSDVLTGAGVNTGLKAEVDDSYVPTIGLEYYLTDNISIEAIAGTGYHTVSVPGIKAALDPAGAQFLNDDIQKVAHLPPTVTAKYHFNTQGKFSPYVGAGVTYIWFYSEDSKNGIDLNIKDGWGYAAQVGLDINTASKWSYNIDVKKIMFNTDWNIGTAFKGDIDLDPTVVSVGVGYKF